VELREACGRMHRQIQVPTQQLFSLASQEFPHAEYKFENHLRGILFRARYVTWRYFFEGTLSIDEAT